MWTEHLGSWQKEPFICLQTAKILEKLEKSQGNLSV